MEDQSTDSGDLTTDAATASVPQGKVARSRHRLPRQKARQLEQHEEPGIDEAAQATEATEAESATPTMAETVQSELEETPAAVAVDDDTAADQTAEVEAMADSSVDARADSTPKPRRRGRWGRAKVTEPAKATAVEEEPVEDATVATDADAPTDPDEPEPVLVPHRPAGRTLKAVAIAAAVLFVAAGAFAGATAQPYLADRAAVFTKFEIAETAANAITTLWTYTPDDMDKLPERSAKYLGGDFAADYRRYIDAIVAPNKQAQITNNTQVLGAAVESLTPTEATAIVYTNSVATSPVTKGIPSLRYLSYRLSMKRDGSRWLITQMVAVTKLDLTPRL